MKPIVFGFPDDQHIADQLTAALDADAGSLEWRHFPDRESLITLQGSCAQRDVIVICTLTDPDAKSMPLYLSAITARELGARRVGLVAPYLGYMRQDHRFLPGQSLSAHAYARFLSTAFDWLVTVDPHLHRIDNLQEIFSIPSMCISAMPAVADWIQAHVQQPVIVGPDRESDQWAGRVARTLDVPYIVLDKIRSGDREVKLSAVDPAVVGSRNPVIVDDIASSGHTLAEVLRGLATLGIDNAACVVVHALFAEGAERTLRKAGATRVVSTNTVAHSTNDIDVVPLIADGLRAFLTR